MEFYSRSSSAPSTTAENEPLQVNIKSGKKIRACISQALKLLQTSKDKVLITGSGPTVTKAITTAEIIKRKVKGLHQQNSLFYTKTEDLWEPKQEGLDQLKVTRNVPSISILLSFQPLDDNTVGYQAPGVSQPLVQFRDEDIELADEQYEGKTDLRQSQGQQKTTEKGKPGRKQNHKRRPPNQKELDNKNSCANEKDKMKSEERSFPSSKDSNKKRGRYEKPVRPSKRPHSDQTSSSEKDLTGASTTQEESSTS